MKAELINWRATNASRRMRFLGNEMAYQRDVNGGLALDDRFGASDCETQFG